MTRTKFVHWCSIGAATLALGAMSIGSSPAAAAVGPVCGGMDEAAAQAAGFVTLDFSAALSGQLVITPFGQKDWVVGSELSDTIDTRDRIDVVCSLGGADFVFSGTSADEVYLGDGSDYAEGGGASDFVSGGPGGDEIHGDAPLQVLPSDGQDTLQGGDDADFLSGGGKADTLFGGQGGNDNDDADGGPGADSCFEMELATVIC